MIRILILALVLLAAPAWGQTVTLTPQQMATLKTYLTTTTDPTLQALVAARADGDIAGNLNSNLSTCVVWRKLVTLDEYTGTVSPIATSFAYSGTGGLISRSQGELVSFIVMFLNPRQAVDPSLANVRAAFTDIFSGAGAAAVNNRNHMAAISKRTATRFEGLYTTGTCTDTTPGQLVLEGPVTTEVVARALNP